MNYDSFIKLKMRFNPLYIVLFLLITSKINAQAQVNDCVDAIIVCGTAGYSGLTAVGVGTQELSGLITCNSQENNSIWLRLNINTAGTLAFTLKPSSNNIDIDFDYFIFGPNTTCGNLGRSIRCSTTNPEAAGQGNNWTGLNNTETDTSEGPGELGNSFLKNLDVQAGETYFLVVDRPIGDSNFSIEWTGTATFFDPPALPIITGGSAALDLKKCDTDALQNQRTKFDFTDNTALIVGSQANVSVTYHLNENDAIVGENAIPDPTAFENTSNLQDIHYRVRNTITGCFTTSRFSIEVENFVAIPSDKAAFCDNANDGDDSNGLITFNLNEVTAKVFNNADMTGLTVSYYKDQTDAFPENTPLTTFTNTVPGGESIYMKVKNADGCYEIREIQLIVNPLPAKTTTTLVQCDTELNPDGITLFNLTQATDALTNNDQNLSVLYFENTTDESANQDTLTSYVNLTNPQTIIARITNITTGCSSLSTVELSVNVTPTRESFLYECDLVNSEDGFSNFDLTDTNLTTLPSETVRFYETLSDALLEENTISNFTNYENSIAYNDILYARVEDGNNCAGISIVNLEVYQLPDIDPESDGDDYICTNLPNNFITINAGLLSGLTFDYTYIWRLDGNIFPKISYAIQVNQAGTYTVEVINKVTACRKMRTIVVNPSNDPEVASVEVQDVTIENNTVTVNLTPESIGDYEYSFDDPNGSFQTSNFFENVPSGIHEIYIRDIHGCGIISQTVVIIGLPKFFTPNGDGINDFWKVDGVNSVFNNSTQIYIFTRDGKLVKEIPARDATGWDGMLNGYPLPSDDYWYVINLTDGRTAKGHFALKR